jgi:hypothetical protein
MLTWLRIIVSSFCLVLCVLFAALWVQSYRSTMVVAITPINSRSGLSGMNEFLSVWCSRGLVRIQITPHPTRVTIYTNPRHPNISRNSTRTKWIWDIVPRSADLQITPLQTQYLTTWKGWFGFGWSVSRFNGNVSRTLTFPILMPTVVCGFLAVLIRSKLRWQFGLRDLFAVTTVAALIIGPLAFWLRTISP